MTAYRIVTDHRELENVGQLTHVQLDDYLVNSSWLIVSGATGPVPNAARRLKAGSGISLVDTGPSGDLIITAAGVSGSGTQIKWLESPSGIADGVNVDFVLSNPPLPTTSLMFFINGVLQEQGVNSDYLVLSGTTIHVFNNYRSGSNVRATYPY